jgi:hypothetical protein
MWSWAHAPGAHLENDSPRDRPGNDVEAFVFTAGTCLLPPTFYFVLSTSAFSFCPILKNGHHLTRSICSSKYMKTVPLVRFRGGFGLQLM